MHHWKISPGTESPPITTVVFQSPVRASQSIRGSSPIGDQWQPSSTLGEEDIKTWTRLTSNILLNGLQRNGAQGGGGYEQVVAIPLPEGSLAISKNKVDELVLSLDELFDAMKSLDFNDVAYTKLKIKEVQDFVLRSISSLRLATG